MEDVYIVGYARTPTGSFLGGLSSLSAVELGSIAIKGALKNANVLPENVDCVYMGNVISANLGQAPATQASIFAGIPSTVPTTGINKVCASGMKAIMIGAQEIQLGNANIVVAGGMESMSNVPHYIPKSRTGTKYGHQELIDGLMKDGLWDVYNQFLMGNAAELCAKEHEITREEQDHYTIASYEKAIKSHLEGVFNEEIVPVSIQVRGKSTVVLRDEEIDNFDKEKTLNAKPVFQADGIVTAAASSNLTDGASCIILASKKAIETYNLIPLAKVLSYADASQDPARFTTTPSLAIPKALQKCGISINKIEIFEINEAFSVVALANLKILGVSADKCNIYGGGVSMGHPLGSSGSRIVGTLVNAMTRENKKLGVASICNGGGGASAIVLERCQ